MPRGFNIKKNCFSCYKSRFLNFKLLSFLWLFSDVWQLCKKLCGFYCNKIQLTNLLHLRRNTTCGSLNGERNWNPNLLHKALRLKIIQENGRGERNYRFLSQLKMILLNMHASAAKSQILKPNSKSQSSWGERNFILTCRILEKQIYSSTKCQVNEYIIMHLLRSFKNLKIAKYARYVAYKKRLRQFEYSTNHQRNMKCILAT